ncbi:tyrosine-type recombinase/integrase [Microbacterium ureisolvens]|uniref:Tyrosine-type recombinase/integrase n=1 Tax=Microbacterium ureisolvens TaxID=2781186 RepID=A0ABS7I391_9MICO|nr:tyrosine-type recombinase/integrase [Microbacterium ureisolvens]
MEDVILLMLGTSIRPGEALALRREDVIFVEGRMKIKVVGTVSTTKKFGTVRKDTLKRERQKRTITVPSFTAEVLRRRLASYVDNPDGLLFPTRRGTPRQTNNINRLLRAFRATYAEELIEVGIVPEHLTARLLRKAAATTIANAADPKLAQLLLGHADVRTTIAHYIKPNDEVPDVTAEMLDARYHFGSDSVGPGRGA